VLLGLKEHKVLPVPKVDLRVHKELLAHKVLRAHKVLKEVFREPKELKELKER
jgi:hypothetical protein